MSTLKKLSVLSAGLLLVAGLAACEQKGPAEKLGAQIDRTVEKAQEKLEEATKPEGPMEKAGKKLDQVVEDTKEAIKK